MSALFSRWSDSTFRLGCFGVASLVVGVPVFLMIWVRTPLHNDIGSQIDQPVEFDHRHHVRDDGIDCLYCHYNARRAATAGIPETELCMGCHAQIWPESPLLEPVHASWNSGQPIPWRRVHDLPEFAYFNHAVHVQNGIGCETCHGRVDLMANVFKVNTLSMGWCLRCHRKPGAYLRPPELATVMGYQPDEPQAEIAARLVRELDIDPPTDCTTCHR